MVKQSHAFGLICLLGLALFSIASPAQPASAQGETIGPPAWAEARQVAADDPLLSRALVLCSPNPDREAVAREDELPATRIFDDLYFVGNKAVSAWLWRGPDGFVLIDTLGGPREAQVGIVVALEQFGIAPAEIVTVIITHGHLDHSGAASFLRERFPRARFAMT